MARYRGPKAKISRKFGEPILGDNKALQKKPYAPGMHGRNRRRKKSDYAIQLAEKQKAKYTYGVLEKQFARTFTEAARRQGVTGEILLQLLEARLDNTVYRLGFASTRRAARQLVGHKHVLVNGVLTNIPSFLLKPGDVVSIRERSKSLESVSSSVSASANKKFAWLEMDSSDLKGTIVKYPEREQIPENIQEQLIVELYSK